MHPVCRKYGGQDCQQKMADLPLDRIEPNEPPLTNTGLDYFGPIAIKRGRSIVKWYGVLFTCLATKAIHLEIAHSLDTDSCIDAIRRFMTRRGVVKVFREMREQISRWNESHFQAALHQQSVTRKFNPPSGSHIGGFWERLIRSLQKIMYSIMCEQNVCLDDESLQILFCQE